MSDLPVESAPDDPGPAPEVPAPADVPEPHPANAGRTGLGHNTDEYAAAHQAYDLSAGPEEFEDPPAGAVVMGSESPFQTRRQHPEGVPPEPNAAGRPADWPADVPWNPGRELNPDGTVNVAPTAPREVPDPPPPPPDAPPDQTV